MAQSAARSLRKGKVLGSIPSTSTTRKKKETKDMEYVHVASIVLVLCRNAVLVYQTFENTIYS